MQNWLAIVARHYPMDQRRRVIRINHMNDRSLYKAEPDVQRAETRPRVMVEGMRYSIAYAICDGRLPSADRSARSCTSTVKEQSNGAQQRVHDWAAECRRPRVRARTLSRTCLPYLTVSHVMWSRCSEYEYLTTLTADLARLEKKHGPNAACVRNQSKHRSCYRCFSNVCHWTVPLGGPTCAIISPSSIQAAPTATATS